MLEDKTAICRAIDFGSGDVCGQQVRGELDTVEVPLNTISKVFDGFGFG